MFPNYFIAQTSMEWRPILKFVLFNDNSGYFTFGSKSGVATIWKYSFLTSSGEYQIISNILNGYGFLQLSENKFFLLWQTSANLNNIINLIQKNRQGR